MKGKSIFALSLTIVLLVFISGSAFATSYSQTISVTVDSLPAIGSSTVVKYGIPTTQDYGYGVTSYSGINYAMEAKTEYCYWDSFAGFFYYNHATANKTGAGSVTAMPAKAPLIIGSSISTATTHTVVSNGVPNIWQSYKRVP
jgi:hypothetical protein